MKVNRLPFTKMIWFFYQLSHPTKSHFLTKILHLPFLLVSKKNSSFFKPKGIFPPTSTPLPRCEVLHFSGHLEQLLKLQQLQQQHCSKKHPALSWYEMRFSHLHKVSSSDVCWLLFFSQKNGVKWVWLDGIEVYMFMSETFQTKYRDNQNRLCRWWTSKEKNIRFEEPILEHTMGTHNPHF